MGGQGHEQPTAQATASLLRIHREVAHEGHPGITKVADEAEADDHVVRVDEDEEVLIGAVITDLMPGSPNRRWEGLLVDVLGS